MGDTWGRVVAFIFAILFMTLVPALFVSQKADDIIQAYVDNKANKFKDICRETGVVSEENYYSFVKSLGATGYGYRITLTHYADEAVPELDSEGNYTGKYLDAQISNEALEIEEYFSTNTNREGTPYKMKKGDHFAVNVVCTEPTVANQLYAAILQKIVDTTSIGGTYNGVVGTTAQN